MRWSQAGCRGTFECDFFGHGEQRKTENATRPSPPSKTKTRQEGGGGGGGWKEQVANETGAQNALASKKKTRPKRRRGTSDTRRENLKNHRNEEEIGARRIRRKLGGMANKGKLTYKKDTPHHHT